MSILSASVSALAHLWTSARSVGAPPQNFPCSLPCPLTSFLRFFLPTIYFIAHTPTYLRFRFLVFSSQLTSSNSPAQLSSFVPFSLLQPVPLSGAAHTLSSPGVHPHPRVCLNPPGPISFSAATIATYVFSSCLQIVPFTPNRSARLDPFGFITDFCAASVDLVFPAGNAFLPKRRSSH
jgi:hypothetical protein